MKHINLKKTFAVLFATACCVNVFAYWPGAHMPIIPYDIPKAWDYNQNNWMSGIPNDTPLNKISMVSSHDAGMDENYWVHATSLSSTQFYNIYQQAMYGVRFFDIRVKWLFGAYYACHGVERGWFLDRMFEQAVKFIEAEENKTEVLILELSHWQNETQMKDVLGIIERHPEWTQHFYKAKDESTLPPILNEVTLGEVRGQIIILVDDNQTSPDHISEDARDNHIAKDKGYGFTPAKGFWQFGGIAGNNPCKGKYGFFRLYDSYSGTDDFGYMKSDQTKKFHDFVTNYNKKTDSFLLCWQLTYDKVYELASKCNPHLDEDLNELVLKEGGERPNLVNLDYIDERICNIVINQNMVLRDMPSVSYLAPRYDEGRKELIEEHKYCDHYFTIEGDYSDVYHFTSGWYVVKGNVHFRKGAVAKGSDVNIILKEGSILTITGDGQPGITTDDATHALKIYAQSNEESSMGKMIVSASNHNAAIGGSENHSGRNIFIYGGNIQATGGDGAAAIGGGYAGEGENINIYGGVVKATSSHHGAAIGGGTYNRGGAVGKYIRIYGGKVEADASKDSERAAAIGGGEGGDGQHIYIYGGNVKAIGTSQGAGIGGGARWDGNGGRGDVIEIHGGEVYAKGGSAIGGAKDSNGRNIKIFGGKVTAVAHENGYSAAIGGGHGGSGEDITISGGRVTVIGGKSGAGIGGGCRNGGGANATNITISGGTIDISNITNGHSIGSANDGSSSNIVICGGSVWARSAGSGVDNPKDSNGTSGRPVREVTVPECGSSDTPVHLYGLPSYGCNDLFPKSGELKIWLPDGSYNFSSEITKYHANVSGAPTTASVASRSAEVVVGDSGYATIYSNKKLIVPDGVEVYAYNFKYGTEELHSTSIGSGQILPASQGYVIKAKEGTYHFFETDGTPVSVDSILKGVLHDSHISEVGQDKVVYGLGRVNGKTAFYKYTSNYLKAGKAYLIKNK